MRHAASARRCENRPLDDSWLFADPMCLDDEEPALEDDGRDDGWTSVPRIRAPVAPGHRLRAMALAAFTGMVLGAGVVLLAADLPRRTDLALSCPPIQPLPPGFHGSARGSG